VFATERSEAVDRRPECKASQTDLAFIAVGECLPQRSRQMLLDEMAQMGPARGRDVRAAQSAMIETAKNMADEGTIELPKAGEEEDEFFE